MQSEEYEAVQCECPKHDQFGKVVAFITTVANRLVNRAHMPASLPLPFHWSLNGEDIEVPATAFHDLHKDLVESCYAADLRDTNKPASSQSRSDGGALQKSLFTWVTPSTIQDAAVSSPRRARLAMPLLLPSVLMAFDGLRCVFVEEAPTAGDTPASDENVTQETGTPFIVLLPCPERHTVTLTEGRQYRLAAWKDGQLHVLRSTEARSREPFVQYRLRTVWEHVVSLLRDAAVARRMASCVLTGSQSRALDTHVTPQLCYAWHAIGIRDAKSSVSWNPAMWEALPVEDKIPFQRMARKVPTRAKVLEQLPVGDKVESALQGEANIPASRSRKRKADS